VHRPLENAIENGVEVMTGAAFLDFILQDHKICGVRTNRGDFGCRWAINSAGVNSDEVMHKAGVRPEFKINTRRGEYYILDRSEIEMGNILFPVPTGVSKGILVFWQHPREMCWLDPNSQEAPDKEDKAVTSQGFI